jgi:hypothetical protein
MRRNRRARNAAIDPARLDSDRIYRRVPAAADAVDLSEHFVRKLLLEGKLTRFKIGTAVLVNMNELFGLIRPKRSNRKK